MKFIDTSKEPIEEIDVLTLRDVAYKLSVDGTYGQTVHHRLQNWYDDPEIETPEPDYVVAGQCYWLPSGVEVWQKYYNQEIEKENDRKAKELVTQTLSKSDIVEKLIALAENIENRNGKSYSHNRGNSLRDGRLRVVKLEGAYEFVLQLLSNTPMTPDQNQRFTTVLDAAKSHVKMQ